MQLARPVAGPHRMRALIWAICIALAALTAVGHLAAGPFYSLDLFYLVPVLIAARFLGRNTGLALALAFAVLAVAMQALTGHPLRYQLFLAAWAGVMKLAVWAVAVWLVCDRQRQLERQHTLIGELQATAAELSQLKVLLPVCAWCKRVRGSNGNWQRLEDYLHENTNTTVTHSICADCARKATSGLRSGPPKA